MNAREKAVVQKKLETLGARLRAEAEAVTTDALTPPTGVRGGELSNAPFHLADMGTEEFLSMMNATLLENELQLAGEVSSALSRLEDGTYGICEHCQKAIPEERLNALPFARRCVTCAALDDTQHEPNINTGRPRGPAETMAPEGEMFESRGKVSAGATRRELPHQNDGHAIGTAGGGTAFGGLAGTNLGHGDPALADVSDATGSGQRDVDDARDQSRLDPAERY